ncbi:unnamed protein product [Adineta ricciae]|uniref:LCCL domain-containing protein n=2 Tax=Adineta ricciae TaxID=249248 RepID=A0A815I3N4_ADIRI|nr:unnamed protein product [Adineta ricciae]
MERILLVVEQHTEILNFDGKFLVKHTVNEKNLLCDNLNFDVFKLLNLFGDMSEAMLAFASKADKLRNKMAQRRSLNSSGLMLIQKVTSHSLSDGDIVPDVPINLEGYRGKVGRIFSFAVTGNTDGPIWGTDIYTDDSNIATAAVHAGIIDIGETKIVDIKVFPGQQAYFGSTREGITSLSYGKWSGSFFFTKKPLNFDMTIPNVQMFRDKVGQILSFKITGSDEGLVWGTHIYTDNSNLATAAVHAGLVTKGEKKVVHIQILPGQFNYHGMTQNGISSLSYNTWEGSYAFCSKPQQ